ncbi:50S ribosome-binding GTPase [Leptolyngbya sp. FACHB-321]|uniref:GTPase n=1 Tax=Leptolyngbya sp. FACHB-321 TaxID=2692807 RepID=UPI0016828ADF|nr:GTPase [Leptolyngbya sp. FACHB-321]MBD2033860.1 50S ribosome-binding GTPase [Leptolyngbya sp. FACHB-321]
MITLNFGQKFPQALSQIQRCNVLVIGNTGVGKSTLISALFNRPFSNTVTQKISAQPYTKTGLPIAVYDTPGLEKDKKQRQKVKQDVAKFIRQQNQKEPSEQIHAVWYCVNSQVTRPTEIDSNWLDSVAKDLPVLAVITRANGVEAEWLQPYLENTLGLQRVVPVLTKKENLRTKPIEPYGLDSLLSATEDLIEEIAQKAISNAVNAKAEQSYAWCRDGCAKVLAAQLVPVPVVKLATAPLQVSMLGSISKTFGYQFNPQDLGNLVKTVTAVAGFNGLDLLLEDKLSNLPGIDYNNIQTVKDVMSHLATSLNHAAGILPFKEQLLGILTDLSNSHWVGALPILRCITAIATTLLTGFLAVAYIEAMKEYKEAEYKGQPLPALEKELVEKAKQLKEVILQSIELAYSGV